MPEGEWLISSGGLNRLLMLRTAADGKSWRVGREGELGRGSARERWREGGYVKPWEIWNGINDFRHGVRVGWVARWKGRRRREREIM